MCFHEERAMNISLGRLTYILTYMYSFHVKKHHEIKFSFYKSSSLACYYNLLITAQEAQEDVKK